MGARFSRLPSTASGCTPRPKSSASKFLTPSAQLDQAYRDVIKAQGLADGYLRPIAWRGAEEMGVAAKNTKIHVAVACWYWGSYFPEEERMKGIRLRWADYRRPDPMTAPCRAKAAGLYMICTIEKHKSIERGYADALMLDWQGRVAEATGANVFFVKDGKLHTPMPIASWTVSPAAR